MGRLPFDPGKMRAGSKPAPAKPDDGVLSVSRLAALIRGAIEQHLPAKIRVVGEVSGSRQSTHLYFALKDAGAVISAVVFAGALRRLGFEPRDGQEVLATGRIEFYEPQGKLTLIVEKLEPVGQGAHELRFRQLCEEIRALGWFAAERKRPLPTFPRRVAVITSRTGAALQDVLDTMARRCPAVGVLLVPVRVQGEGAAEEVVLALRRVSRDHAHLGVDAVIVTRGGGSPEDLAAFNDREVARAIVECAVPVVAAIGHETDTTIAELVADERCATPTQAAMRLTPDREAIARQIDALEARFRTDLARTLRYQRQRVDAASRHPVLADPRGAAKLARERLARLESGLATQVERSVQAHHRRLDTAALALERRHPGTALASARAAHTSNSVRLGAALRQSLSTAHSSAISLSRRLESVGPAAVLRRGYSCTRRADGTIVRSASDVSPGERISTQLASGSLDSEVLRTAPGEPALSRPAAGAQKAQGPPRKRANPAEKPDQLDLFTRGG